MTAPAAIPARNALKQGFQLADLRVEPQAAEVTGPGGRERLDPKVMDVLVMLAQNAGQVVSRELLLAQLWPKSVVTDDALTRCIYELRRQLSQAGGDEHYRELLETLPKRGYRLNGAVSALAAPAGAGAPGRPKWRVAALLAIVAAAILALVIVGQRNSKSSDRQAPISIAVMPFEDLSGSQNQQHLSDGIPEEIIDRLVMTRSVRVIARGSSFAFKGQAISIPEIAAKLNVTHVLEGSVRRSGNRVRITSRLVDASSNSQLWSETYDRELGDLFAIQDGIAASVAGVLRIKLAAAASHSSAPVSAEAYELFLQGEFFYNRRAPGDMALAEKYFKDSLAIEPDYARAWAALAGVYSLLAYDGDISPEIGLKKEGEAVHKAVDLDPGLAVGHARMSQYYWDLGDRDIAYKALGRAMALDPEDSLVLNFAAGIAMRNGEVGKAIELQRRLVERDPRSASHRANLGIYLQATDRLDEARSELQKALELNPDLGWEAELAVDRILVLQRQFERAGAAIGRLPQGELRDHGQALLYYAEGRRAEADAALERLAASSTQSVDVRLAEVYAFRGMKDRAFETLAGLELAIKRNEPFFASQVWSWQVELQVSPFLKGLHDDPRWQALLVEPRSVSS